jgi:hypothetical protein
MPMLMRDVLRNLCGQKRGNRARTRCSATYSSTESLEVRQLLSAGLRPLGDFSDAPASYLSKTFGFTVSDSGSFFIGAGWGNRNRELWVSKADTDSPHLVKDLNNTGASSVGNALGSVSGGVVFEGFPSGRTDLWFSDGTADGTVAISPAAWSADSMSRDVLDFARIGNTAYGLTRVAGGHEIWSTDGSENGTERVLSVDEMPGSVSGARVKSLEGAINGRLILTVTMADDQKAVYAIDPVRKKFDQLGVGDTLGSIKVSMDSLVFATATGEASPADFFRSDGTTAGTIRLGTAASVDAYLVSESSGSPARLVSPSYDAGAIQTTVYVTDLSSAPDTPFRLMAIPAISNRFNWIELAGDNVYLMRHGVNPDTGVLWSTDGTESGTRLVRHRDGTSVAVTSIYHSVVNGSLLVSVKLREGQADRYELWSIQDGGRRQTPLAEAPYWRRQSFFDIQVDNNRAMAYGFSDLGTGSTTGLVVTDGTVAGTTASRTLVSSTASSDLMNVVGAPYVIVNSVTGESRARTLWLLSESGTARQIPVPSGSLRFRRPSMAYAVDSRNIVVYLDSPAQDRGFAFVLDIETMVTSLVHGGRGGLRVAGALAGWLYFAGEGYGFGPVDGELYATDASGQTRGILGWGRHSETRNQVVGIHRLRDQLLLSVATSGHSSPSALYVSDGTMVGTRRVLQFPRGASFVFSVLAVGDEMAYFAKKPPGLNSRSELWSTDGTVAGTRRIARDINARYPTGFVVGRRLFSNELLPGGILMVSNGLASSTRPLTDPATGEVIATRLLTVSGQFAYFVYRDGVYRTDGTPDGTVRLIGLRAERIGAVPGGVVILYNRRLFLVREDGTTEFLFSLRAVDSPTAVDWDSFQANGDSALVRAVSTNSGFEPSLFVQDKPVRTPGIPKLSFDRIGNHAIVWSGLIGANNYTVEAERFERGSWIAILTEEVPGTALRLTTGTKPGLYRARARAWGVDGTATAWSAWGLSLYGNAPQFKEVPAVTTTSRRSYRWLTPHASVSSEVWISDLDTKKRVFHQRNIHSANPGRSALFLTTELPPSRYVLWVRSRFADGRWSDWSDPRVMDVRGAAPSDLRIDNVDTNSGSVDISWDTVRGADLYEIHVAGGPRARLVEAPQTSYRMPRLSGGMYTFWIRARKNGRAHSEWSSPVNILIARPPQVRYEDSRFRWLRQDSVESYEITIRDGAGNVLQHAPGLTGNTNVFEPDHPLPFGIVSVSMRAVFAGGEISDWSNPSTFELFRTPTQFDTGPVWTSDATPVISWDRVPGVVYELYIGTEKGPAIYRRDGLTEGIHRVQVPLPVGDVHVWMRGTYPDGSRTAWGLGKFLDIGRPPDMTVTRSLISWSAIYGSTHYELWIEYLGGENAPRTRIVHEPLHVGRSYQFPDTLPRGRYVVWVRAIRAEAGGRYLGRWSAPVYVMTR